MEQATHEKAMEQVSKATELQADSQQPTEVLVTEAQGENDVQISEPETQHESVDDLEANEIPELVHNTDNRMMISIVDFILGPNQSDPIWRLRLLTTFILVLAMLVGVLFLLGYLHGIHATYQRVMLIISVSAPVGVAGISLCVSFWLPSDQINWIIGLLVANASMLAAAIVVVYLALHAQREITN